MQLNFDHGVFFYGCCRFEMSRHLVEMARCSEEMDIAIGESHDLWFYSKLT